MKKETFNEGSYIIEVDKGLETPEDWEELDEVMGNKKSKEEELMEHHNKYGHDKYFTEEVEKFNQKKLNFGSGKDYRDGWVNIDCNKNVKADVYADIGERLPFEDNTFDYVLCSHIIEHFDKKQVFKIMEELQRICKKGAIIDIYVPHYTSTLAFKVPYHYSFYGIGTFRIFEEEDTEIGERYSPARFKVLKEELHFVLRKYDNYKFLKYLGCLNFLFNFNRFWQLLSERIFLWGFDEIYYKLEVVK